MEVTRVDNSLDRFSQEEIEEGWAGAGGDLGGL